MDWKPITDRSALAEIFDPVVVGWWVDMPDVGLWWEVSDDWLDESATHYCVLPVPPRFTPPHSPSEDS